MITSQRSYAYSLAEAIHEAADNTISNYNFKGGPGGHKGEDGITDGFIESVLNIDYSSWNLPNYLTVTPDRHLAHIEHQTGADLAILYDVELVNYTLQTAVLFQAKRQDTKHYQNFAKAKEQCGKMLSFTTDSFIFDYSPNEICAVPAVSVAGTRDAAFNTDTTYPKKYHKKSVKSLFKELFMGYLGNEHTYWNLWGKTKTCSTPRRNDPIYTDGGNEEIINDNDGMRILTIRVTGEKFEEM